MKRGAIDGDSGDYDPNPLCVCMKIYSKLIMHNWYALIKIFKMFVIYY